MELDFDIAKWVREAREKSEMSQEDLGERLGKTKGNISAWENGRHEPSFRQILQIVAVTGHQLPMNIGAKINKAEPANDALQLDPDDLITMIRGFKSATAAERQAILQISGRALARTEGKNNSSIK